jgi:hypothetical protein
MARTAEGAALTQRHRQAQLALRAQSLRDFTRLWPLWKGDQQSFEALIAATLPLVNVHRRTSSALGSAFYEAFRKAERVAGSPTPRAADPVDEKRVVGSMFATGLASTRKALGAGMTPEAAMRAALVGTSGALARHILNGGRDSLLGSIAADPKTQGWIRMTGGDPCAFCALLAGRGAVYAESSADFQAHDHCSCFAEPLYEGSELPAENQRFKAAYDRAIASARESGELERGTSNDLLNAFRREFSAA